MKYLLNFLFAALSLTFARAQTEDKISARDFESLSWLEGTWHRTDMSPGQTAHEVWEKTAPDRFSGAGVLLHGQDTVFFEKLSIIIKEGSIFYVADVPENPHPVYFQFTMLSDSGFVCENPRHDFPKKIRYTLEGDVLKAQISGNGKAFDFLFMRE